MKNIATVVTASFMGAVIALMGVYWLNGNQGLSFSSPPDSFNTPVKVVNLSPPNNVNEVAFDFTRAAEETIPSVVYIQSSSNISTSEDFNQDQIPRSFRDLFGLPFGNLQPEDRQRQGSGSGVIISADGYIVTNNHVITSAEEISVTLNNRENYKATVIGADPSTDIALIKINAKDLPAIEFSNSDAIKIGQWVVAVGNPFNLESTVTAGIVSAKGRSINIMQDKTPIESFIQTDAAINPGNSGGALVNLNGELVGINTAIASPTGAYAGYGFAVPSNIVIKVISDLKEFGVVQRGFIGARIRNIDGDFAREKGIHLTKGVYVESLVDNSAAKEAGIKEGDVIIAVDGMPTSTSPKLIEMIGRHRPGDKVPLTIVRDGKEKIITATLKNSAGNTDVVVKNTSEEITEKLGASFESISREEANELNIQGGVRISDLKPGILTNQTEVQKGFIVTAIDGKKVRSADELIKVLKNKNGGVMIQGRYPQSSKTYYYAFGID